MGGVSLRINGLILRTFAFLILLLAHTHDAFAECATISCTLQKENLKEHRKILEQDREHLRFKMREGDSIAKILKKLNQRPLWKENGKVERTAQMNSLVVVGPKHRVSYGVTILLPAKKLRPSPAYTVDLKTLYVRFNDPPDPEPKREPERVIAAPDPAVFEAPPVPVSEVKIPTVDFTEDDERKNILKVGYDVNFTRLDGKDPATGGTAVLASDFNHDFALAYRRLINKKWSAGAGVDVNFATYTDTKTRKISGNSGSYINARIDAGYELMPRWSLMGRFSYAQRPFLKTLNSTTLQLERVATLGLGIGAQYLVFAQGKNMMTAESGGGYLFPGKGSSYTIKSGYFVIGTGRFIHQIDKQKSADAALYYRTDQQNSSILDDSTSELGVKISFGYKF